MAPQATKRSRGAWRAATRYGVIAMVVALFLTGAIYASQQFEQFLIRDPRFFLPGPPDYGLESPNLQFEGIQYSSRAQILRIFEKDYGRSLYLFPLAERRKEVLNVRWARDASIVRIWPNRVLVQITERKPAAFVKLPAESISRWALIDEDGVILDPPAKAAFKLPVLGGISTADSQQMRGTRVRRMQRLLKELGDLSGAVSEVDVSDLDNLKLTTQVRGQALSLLMGNHNFSPRLKSFLDHYPDIHRKMPQASSFDLRLDDRITALEANDGQ